VAGFCARYAEETAPHPSPVSRLMRSLGMPRDGRHQGANFVRCRMVPPRHQPTIGGGVMKKLTSAQLFAAPKIAHKTKARLERAKLVVVAARARAAEITQQSAAQPLTMRPTVLQRRRLAQRWRAKS
jgi:hypothetical protein